MSLNEKIKSLETEIISAKDHMVALVKSAEVEGRDLNEVEGAEIETLTQTVEAKEKSLVAYKSAEQTLAKSIATPAIVNSASLGSPKARKGSEMLFAKMATVAVLGHAEKKSMVEVVSKHFANDRELDAVIKASVAPALSTTVGWAQELTQVGYADFLDALRPNSFFAQLASQGTSLNFGNNQTLNLPSAGGTLGDLSGSFVGEGNLIPVKRTTYASKQISKCRMAVISNFSEQLLASSVPNIQALVTQAMIADTAYAIDTALISATPATNGLRPAGLLDGVTAGTSSGSTVADIVADIRALVQPIISANGGKNIVLLMNPAQALGISLSTTAVGEFLFGDVQTNGLLGYKVIVSNNVTAGTVVAMDASAFASAFDTPEFSVSDTATLVQANDVAPVPNLNGKNNILAVDATAQVTSLYQQALVAVRMQMPLGWVMRRDGMVQAITGVTW